MQRGEPMRTGTWSVGNESGLTLVELMLVLVILTLLMVMVVPPLQLGVVDNALFRKTKQDIVTGLRFSRSKAINTREVVTLAINSADGRMRIIDEQRKLHIPDDVTLTMTVAPSERLSENERAVRFYPDGSSTGLELEFRRGERVSRISVDGLTGRVGRFEE